MKWNCSAILIYWVFRFQCIILLYYLYYFLYAFMRVCIFVSVCLSICFYYIVITVFSKMGGQLRQAKASLATRQKCIIFMIQQYICIFSLFWRIKLLACLQDKWQKAALISTLQYCRRACVCVSKKNFNFPYYPLSRFRSDCAQQLNSAT